MDMNAYYQWVESLSEEVLMMVGIIVVIVGFLALVLGVLQLIANWKIFTKAGEKGWKVLIPLYNGHVLYKIIWQPVWYWVLVVLSVITTALAPSESLLVNVILLVAAIALILLGIKSCCKLSKAFGHGGGFAVGLIFLPTIFNLILAFGKSQYVGKCCAEPAEIAESAE